MVVVDSSVWIDFLKPRETQHTIWLEQYVRRNRIGLPDIVLLEVLQGLSTDAVFRVVLQRFEACQMLETCGTDLAVAAARNYRYLRSFGITVRKPVDCLIATLCLRDNHLLLHRDRDFDAFEQHLGLKVIHPVRH